MALLTIPRMVGRKRFAQHIGRKRFAYQGRLSLNAPRGLKRRQAYLAHIKPAGV